MTNNEKELLPLCGCGCGEPVAKKGNKYINGHNRRGSKHSPESKTLMSKSHVQYIINHPEANNENSKRLIQWNKDNPNAGIENSKRLIQWNKDHPEAGKAHSEWLIQYYIDHPEVLKTMSERSIEQWSDSEHHEMMSEIMRNSEAVKTEHERQRGGYDIVKHHFIYDHNNPDQHVVEITRSQHSAHHQWMKRNGLVVPHVNVTDENKDIFRVKYAGG